METTNLVPTFFDEATLINNSEVLLTKDYTVEETITSSTSLKVTFGSVMNVKAGFEIGGVFTATAPIPGLADGKAFAGFTASIAEELKF